MPMNVPFNGSHVRPVKAELSNDGRSIEVTVHNHDHAGLNDRAGVTVLAPDGATHSVAATFDQYLPPESGVDRRPAGGQTSGGGAALGSDIWRAKVPVSSLPPSMQGVSPLQLRVRAHLDEGTARVESGSTVAVTLHASSSTVALPAPEAAFGASSEFRSSYRLDSSTSLGQLSTTILPKDTSAATYKNRSMQHFIKDLTLQPAPDAAARLASVSEFVVELLPIFQRVDKHGFNHPQTAQPFVSYPYRADDFSVRVTMKRQADGTFRAEAPVGEAFARLTSIGGYFTNADDSLAGFAARFPD